MDIVIARVSDLPADALVPLLAESEREGWQFVRRLADEWVAGTNRFDKSGEALFVARVGGSVIGVCGLNADPYTTDESIGRVRRLYVLEAFREIGVGRRLVEAVVAAAAGRFRMLRVRTENSKASRLYERLGFQQMAGDETCTHSLELIQSLPNDCR